MSLSAIVALGLGVCAGLRVFTPLAALSFFRGPLFGAIGVLFVLVEDYMDLQPWVGSRTAPQSLVLRLASGGFCGWSVTAANGLTSGIAGAVLGVAGAVAGTYGGYAVRVRAMEKIGLIPSGIVEDVIAIALAAFLVTR
jgi:uncharacterized membrane protein